jgi:hypothetical protein
MDYPAYLTERALAFRNRAITTRDPRASQELHYLADLCERQAAFLCSTKQSVRRHGRTRTIHDAHRAHERYSSGGDNRAFAQAQAGIRESRHGARPGCPLARERR